MPCRAVPWCAAPCFSVPCHAVPSRAKPCHAVPSRAMLCRAVPRRATPCHAVPNRAMPCHAVPRCATLCHAVPSCTLLLPAVPCRAHSRTFAARRPCLISGCHLLGNVPVLLPAPKRSQRRAVPRGDLPPPVPSSWGGVGVVAPSPCLCSPLASPEQAGSPTQSSLRRATSRRRSGPSGTCGSTWASRRSSGRRRGERAPPGALLLGTAPWGQGQGRCGHGEVARGGRASCHQMSEQPRRTRAAAWGRRGDGDGDLALSLRTRGRRWGEARVCAGKCAQGGGCACECARVCAVMGMVVGWGWL